MRALLLPAAIAPIVFGPAAWAQAPEAAEAAEAAGDDEEDILPDHLSLGIGAGIGGSLGTVLLGTAGPSYNGVVISTIGALRLRLANGLIVEPLLEGHRSRSADVDAVNAPLEQSEGITYDYYRLGTAVLPRIARRDRSELLLGAEVSHYRGWLSSTDVAEGVDPQRDTLDWTSTTVSASGGIQVWLNSAMALDAITTLGGLAWYTSSTETGGEVDRYQTWGVALDPAARVCFYLYW
jgi:hypothetical protein